jgi:hypothetical protein
LVALNLVKDTAIRQQPEPKFIMMHAIQMTIEMEWIQHAPAPTAEYLAAISI